MVAVNADVKRGAIHVDGLAFFQRSLRTADAVAEKEMRAAIREIAERIVLPEVQLRVNWYLSQDIDNVYRRKGTLENSPRARTTGKEGRLLFGAGRSTEYAGWWEFGGSTKTPRGGGRRLIYKDGRTLYPALRMKRDEMQSEIAVALDKVSAVL
jgi:hypothetical protein